MTIIGRALGFMGGVGIPKVYTTWDPANKDAGITLSGSNLIATNATNDQDVRSTIGKSSGKWYWELTFSATVGVLEGVVNASASMSATLSGANAWVYNSPNGHSFNNSVYAAYGAAYGAGDTIGLALDMDAGTLTAYKNNASQGTMSTGLTGTMYAAHGLASASILSVTANFGASAFTYTPPGGYNAGLYN
jgi:hypothetical protein